MDRLTTRNSEGVAVLKTPYRCDRCGEEIYRLADYGSGEPIEKLARYEELFPLPPCAIGDALYEPRPDRGNVTEYLVNGLFFSGYGWFISWILISGIYSNLDGVTADKIGKTVFLTMQEAEEALERMVDGNETD